MESERRTEIVILVFFRMNICSNGLAEGLTHNYAGAIASVAMSVRDCSMTSDAESALTFAGGTSGSLSHFINHLTC